MRILFMGTPAFAVSSLAALTADRDCEVVGVVTQPDRPKGRGHKLVQSPVKEYALEHHYTVLQPEKVKVPEVVAQLADLKPDLIVVAAFGQFLPESILNLPKYGCINVHGSLLPRLRGAAPVQYAILQGDTKAGVTIMKMAKGMDTGDMLESVEVPIGEEMTGGELMAALATAGAELLVKVVKDIATGQAVATPQKEEEATYATLITKEMEKILWTKSAKDLHNQIRAFSPAPGSFTNLPNGKKLKLWQSRVVSGDWSQAKPGTVVEADKHGVVVATGAGFLKLVEVQPESKNKMPADVLVNGNYLKLNDVLGVEA
jgi:methionyl-tRNA formyltransferase